MDILGFKLKKKRKHDRKLYCAIAFLMMANQEYTCAIENISKGGAMLSVDVSFPIKIGELVDIQIPYSDGKRYVKKTAKVLRFNENSIAIKFLW